MPLVPEKVYYRLPYPTTTQFLSGFVNLKRSESEVIAVVRFPRRNCALSTAACQTNHLAPRLEAACHLLTVVLRF